MLMVRIQIAATPLIYLLVALNEPAICINLRRFKKILSTLFNFFSGYIPETNKTGPSCVRVGNPNPCRTQQTVSDFQVQAKQLKYKFLPERVLKYKVQISAIESAEVSFDQQHQSFIVKQTQRQKYVLLQFLLNKALNSHDAWTSLIIVSVPVECSGLFNVYHLLSYLRKFLLLKRSV